MAELELKICMGTMCYVMGGAELRGVVESLPEDIKKLMKISYCSCLGKCETEKEPPYIELNGKTVAYVSKANLIQILKEELKNVV